MCAGCYGEHFEPEGAPSRPVPPLRPEMADLAARISRFYDDGNPAGGALHVVLDDWNLEDEHIARCQGDRLTGEEPGIAAQLLALTLDERHVVLRACETMSGMSDHAPATVPVSVLETLAIEWEGSATRLNEAAARAAERGALPEHTEAMAARADILADCARRLREAMAGNGQDGAHERPSG